MRKKLISILVVLMLLVSIVSLAGCNFDFGNGDDGKLDNNAPVIPSAKEEIEQNKTEEEDNSFDLVINSVAGKKFEFSMIAVQKIIYPSFVEITDENGEELTLPSDEEVQIYLDELYLEYQGAKLVFGKDNTVKRVMNGYTDEEAAIYKQDLSTFTIGSIIDDKYVPQISGTAYKDYIIIEFDLEGYITAYLEFDLV